MESISEELILLNIDDILCAISSMQENEKDDIPEEDLEIIKKYNIELLSEGEGGGRIAYSVGDTMVVKVPKSEDGELQSNLENEISEEEILRILCVTLETEHKDIVLQERLTPLKNVPEEMNIIDYLKSFRSELVEFYEWEISYLVTKYDLLEEDILKISSWGKDKKNSILLYDYGCSNALFEEYYE